MAGEIENTDLIDVSDIEPRFEGDIEDTTDRGHPRAALPEISSSRESEGPQIASIKDRFAALCIDGTFIYAIYWFIMIAFRAIAFDTALGPIPAAGLSGLAFHGIFLLMAILWFVIPELIFGASVGKIACHLIVRKTDGGYPSFISVLVRNLLLPLDIVLFPAIIAAALMEWTRWHQRTGDIAARTIVLQNLSAKPRQYALSLDIVASASRRAIAFLFDLALLAAFGLGYALLLNPEAPLASQIFLVISPLFLIIFFVLPEWLSGTSPGKWLLGLMICLEDGSAIDLPSSIVRTLWRIFDSNVFGFMTAIFSVRRQRPGDAAAGSVVIRAPRGWGGAIALAAVVIASLATLYAGLMNRDSFLSSGFQMNFLPSIEMRGVGMLSRRSPVQFNIVLKNFRFAAGDPSSVRHPAMFEPGETLFFVFEIDGYEKDGARVWLQEDVAVRYPDDSVGLKLENINDFNREVAEEGPIRFENNIAIPPNAQPGRYTVTITVRDKLTRQELKEQRFFYVTPFEAKPAPQQQPAPPKPSVETSVPRGSAPPGYSDEVQPTYSPPDDTEN